MNPLRSHASAGVLASAFLALSGGSSPLKSADLIAYWNFDDTGNPGIALDSANGYAGTLQGGASFTADGEGHSGQPEDHGVDFGTTDNGQTVLIGDASFLNSAAASDRITFSFWQKLTSAANSSSFWAVSPGSNGNQRGMQVHLPWSNGTIYYDSAGCCGSGSRSSSTPPAPFDWTVWHHFVVLKDGDTKQIWIDGSLVLNDTGADALPSDFSSLYLGSELGRNSLRGVMDEFAVYNGALTPAQIASLASGTSPSSLFSNPDLAALSVSPAANVTTTGATLGGTITDIGAEAPTVTIFHGDEDAGNEAGDWDHSIDLPGPRSGTFASEISNLQPGRIYFFTARAINNAGTSWSAETESFTTAPLPPTIENTPAEDLQAFSARVGVRVVSNGGEGPSVTIYFGPSDGGDIPGNWAGFRALDVTDTGGSVTLGGLNPGTRYFFRAFASNSAGDSWAPAAETFITLPARTATVVNEPADEITGAGARLRGRVLDSGDDTPLVTIFYGTRDGGTDPAAWSRSVSEGLQDDEFSQRVTLLEPETTYYFRARAVNSSGSAWAPSSATFTTTASRPPTIVINEIHYDAEPKTEPAEFVELLNAGDLPIDLTGWRLEGGVDYTFPADTSIEAGAFLVAGEDPATLRSAFGVNTSHRYSKSLNNDGEEVRLIDAANNEVDRVNYRAGFPWPTAARGTGSSMELIHPGLDNNLGGAWRSSSAGQIGPRSTYIAPRSNWRYRRGTSEASAPISAWRDPDFIEDASWEDAFTVIGYGDGDDDTLLDDMRGNYSTIYLRKEFVVPADGVPSRLLLRCYIDDGAVVWINGVEVARFSVSSGDKFHDSTGNSHEGAWEEELINNAGNIIVGGTNVVAVHALNATLNSSDFSFDLELKVPDPGTASSKPTPGAPNSVTPASASTAPPLIRQVNHTPRQPASGEDVLITAKVTDIDEVQSVTLEYQLVNPGRYVRLGDADYRRGWTPVIMTDDGSNGDLLAGDSIYSATLPAAMQINRRLVRYRITTEDGLGHGVTVPYPDDESPNFAYYVYNGVPSWSAAERPGTTRVQRFPAEVMSGSLPVYHLIANGSDVTNSQYSSGSDGVRMQGTLIYDRKVYDHIEFYNRGEASTYVSGKNKWRFKFNRARDFQARDIYGKRYRTSWKTMNFNACASPWVDTNRGMAGIDEAVPHRLYQLAGVPSSNTHWVHFRVVDGSAEAPADQYSGDLWGLYLAIEHPDGRFLTEHDLPDGNTYKIRGGSGDKKNQGPSQPLNSSDWSSFYSASRNLNSVSWWRSNFNLDAFYGFRAINRATGNVDLRDDYNYFMYHHTDNRWNVIPWDLDMMYAPVKHVWSGVIRADRCLDHGEIRTEFRNRCRELIDLLFSDMDRHGGHAAQVVEELSQVINPTGVPLTMVDMDEYMWAYNSRTRGDHRGPWYLLSKTETTLQTNYTRTIQTSGHEGFQQNVIDYMHDTDTGRWSINDGDENGYGYNYLSFEAQDTGLPGTPAINYSGDAGFPANGVRFTSSRFSDPQGPGTFAAMKWRIGEIRNPSTPGYDPGTPWVYEVEPVWESGEIATFTPETSIPARVLRPGHTYRARVRHLDTSGRWSHWSAPLEFVPEAPGIEEYTESLVITEVMYNPIGGSDYEFIELKNIGKMPLDLTDVRFTKGIDFDFPTGTMIEPDGILLVVRNETVFESRYGTGLPVAGEWESGDNLSNAGEQVKLSFGAGTAIRDFSYLDIAPWPTSPDTAGYSLTLRNPESAPDHAQPGNWRASSQPGGSPGSDDSSGGYSDWAILSFTPSELNDPLISGPEADPDNDGLNNLAEFYFNGEPRNPDPSPGTVGQRNGLLSLSFTRRTGAASLTDLQLYSSTDLITWSADPLAEVTTIVDNGDGSETVTLSSSAGPGIRERLFLRLQLSSRE